jgi:hypothetical protein
MQRAGVSNPVRVLGSERVMTRTSSLFAFAILATAPRWGSDQLAPRPPSSIEPKNPKQQVIFSHLHRRVRACASIPNKSPTSCAPQLSDASAATSVFLEPVATLNGAPSRSRRIVVTFPDISGLYKQTLDLPVGEWTIEWPGCREIGRLAISSAGAVAPRVTLRTTSGSCELSSSQCRLVSGTTEQRLAVE